MIRGVTKGFTAYFEAYEIISRLKLWKFFAIPMLISFGFFLIIALLSYTFYDSIGSYITSLWVWDFGKEIVSTISNLFGGFIILIFGFIIFKYTVIALSAPFMGPISKKIEDDFTGSFSQTKVSSSFDLLLRGVRVSSRNLLRELLLTIPIIAVGLIPVIGLFSAVLLFLMQAYFVGFGNMDYTLERYFSYQKSILFVKKHKGVAIGNGIVFMVFLLIPFIGVILVVPFSVTAATIATVKLINEV
tara:strand:- start:24 stop:758 length:735 start_codon:yes stop_codon:yes gene_type:complete